MMCTGGRTRIEESTLDVHAQKVSIFLEQVRLTLIWIHLPFENQVASGECMEPFWFYLTDACLAVTTFSHKLPSKAERRRARCGVSSTFSVYTATLPGRI